MVVGIKKYYYLKTNGNISLIKKFGYLDIINPFIIIMRSIYHMYIYMYRIVLNIQYQ